MSDRSRIRPRDLNALAGAIVGEASEDEKPQPVQPRCVTRLGDVLARTPSYQTETLPTARPARARW
jgi:hypothetical protein